MPIQPIDLQTLFARLNQIGKDQATLKEISPQQQALQASEIAKKSDQQDHSVNEAKEVGEGVEKIHEEEKGGTQQEQQESEKKPPQEKQDKEIVRDPNLGHHIDISG